MKFMAFCRLSHIVKVASWGKSLFCRLFHIISLFSYIKRPILQKTEGMILNEKDQGLFFKAWLSHKNNCPPSG